MDLTNEMHVTKPFGPTIGKIQVIPQFVNDLNDYSNEVIKDKDKAKNLDAGKTLVMQAKAGNIENSEEAHVFAEQTGNIIAKNLVRSSEAQAHQNQETVLSLLK